MEPGETIEETARREANEEAGVKAVKSITPLYSQNNIPISKSSTKRTSGVLMEVEKDFEYPVGDGTEHEEKSETLWLTYQEITTVVTSKSHDLLLELFYKIIQERERTSSVTEQILESLRLLQENQTMNIEEAVNHATKAFQRELTEAANEIQNLSEQLEQVTESAGDKQDALIAENQALKVEAQKIQAQLLVNEAVGTKIHLRGYKDALLECKTVAEVEKFISKIRPQRGPKYIFEGKLDGKAKGTAPISILSENLITEDQVEQRAMAGIKTKEKKK